MGFSLLAYRRLGVAPRWWQILPLLGALAVIVVLDLRTRIIPDIVTVPGLVYALGLGALSRGGPGLGEAAGGLLAAGGVVLLFAVVTRGGIGGGDIKLAAMLGAALGWKGALIALALSQVVGGVLALGLLATRRGRRGSHLPVGALIALFGALLLGQRS